MNEVITKLNEIEEKAGAILSDASARKEQLAAQLEADKRAIDERYAQLEQETVEQQKAAYRAQAKEKSSQLDRAYDEDMQRLTACYETQKESLAEEIFLRIIG